MPGQVNSPRQRTAVLHKLPKHELRSAEDRWTLPEDGATSAEVSVAAAGLGWIIITRSPAVKQNLTLSKPTLLLKRLESLWRLQADQEGLQRWNTVWTNTDTKIWAGFNLHQAVRESFPSDIQLYSLLLLLWLRCYLHQRPPCTQQALVLINLLLWSTQANASPKNMLAKHRHTKYWFKLGFFCLLNFVFIVHPYCPTQ